MNDERLRFCHFQGICTHCLSPMWPFQNKENDLRIKRQRNRGLLPPKRRITGIIVTFTCFALLVQNVVASGRQNRHSLTLPSQYRPNLLSIRGGSSKKRPKRGRKEQLPPTDEYSMDLPKVQALLVARRVKLTNLVQWFSFLALTISFYLCCKTAGRPYSAAVLSTVYGSDTPPKVITAVERLLAHRLAQASGDILPPLHLPSTIPLLGILSSLALWVAATLLPTWFTSLQVWMNHHKMDSRSVSQEYLSSLVQHGHDVSVLIEVPREQRHLESNAKSHIHCPLHPCKTTRKNHRHAHPHPFYFELNHRRIYYSRHGIVDGGPVLHSTVSTQELLRMKGLRRRSELRMAQERFGPYNLMSLPSPTIWMAFVSRISSPLSVLQLVGRILSALEEDFKSSLIGLAATLSHHYSNARKSIISAKQLAKEVQESVQDTSEVWVLRDGWRKVSAVELLPGDVFVLNAPTVMPVDALLLEGSCVTNEAVLTGESIPQTKLPLELDENDESHLDMMGTHRSSILFAGTSLLHCTNDASEENVSADRNPSGPRFLALRTGSYSSRGELMRALARSSGHVGAISNPQTERDALMLIASLSCFAALACASLFRNDKNSPSIFRRVVQCTRIAVASIPSDLPLALSAVAHSCCLRLREEADVVCSEPGSLLTAAHVNVVVFDKTGTLTADTQALSRIVSPQKDQQSQFLMAETILAGCHSLVDLVDETTKDKSHNFVGDPLDLASLQYVGWIYNGAQDAYKRKKKSIKLPDTPVKLWQIKTFPFDANRRTSAALLLVLHADGTCRLWKVVKGSPDVIQHIVKRKHGSWYKKQIQELGGQGLRTIAMATSKVPDDDELVNTLFPNGLFDPTSLSIKAHRSMISHARNAAGILHRSSFEGFGEQETPLRSFDFVGFACFDAAVRPSTRRIIQELQHANVNVIMLTGDGIDAAISVAGTSGLLSGNSIAVLDFDEGHNADKTLVWKTMNKHKVRNSRFKLEDTINVDERSIETMLVKASKGRCTLVITGKAAEFLLSGDAYGDRETNSRLQQNLFRFAIFARASPKQKRAVVSSLKDHCGMKVLMCGDGVNDVAAMKVADVGVALLNGYGHEGSHGNDSEDEQRREKVAQRKIGSNRKMGSKVSPQTDSLSAIGVGSSAAASTARVKAEYSKALSEIQERALARMQGATETHDTIQYNLQDIKDSVLAVFRVLKEERQRTKTLRKGGGAAARILAGEDKLRRELLSTKENKNSFDDIDNDVAPSTIKPGEASLAASFSCLRPSIDGVEALMRVGVAAAACALSVQQTIALNCLLSCYNLATLYRDGFRYGKYLWNAELFFGMAIDQASYQASCTARPRLSTLRPEQSLFNPTSASLVCTQAFVHLMTLTVGVRIANALEIIYAAPNETKSRVRWKEDGHKHPVVFSKLARALAASPRSSDLEGKQSGGLNLLGRPPFQPNYATNIVFFLSIFQNAVSAIVTHTGKPFYGTILESRKLCVSVGLALLFAVAGVSETFPWANAFLELRPLPSRRYRRVFLVLFAVDFFGCFATKWLFEGFGEQRKVEIEVVAARPKSAADAEEVLLAEESKDNQALLLAMFILMLASTTSAF